MKPPFLPAAILLLTACLCCTGCSSAPSPPGSRMEETILPTFTTPPAPATVLPLSEGTAAVRAGAVNASPTPGADACPASRPSRCSDGYCAASPGDCNLHAQVGDCRAGRVNCP